MLVQVYLCLQCRRAGGTGVESEKPPTIKYIPGQQIMCQVLDLHLIQITRN